jgi:phosphoinositide-3-kinase regulatory subunit 4
VILDIRTMQQLHRFSNPLHFGPITCMYLDKKQVWLVVGTMDGVLSLWDLRFGLLLRSWSIGKKRIHRVEGHPSKGKNRWIIVAVEEQRDNGNVSSSAGRLGTLIAEVWDIDRGAKVEEYRVVSPGQTVITKVTSRGFEASGNATAMQEATLDPAKAIEALLLASHSKKSVSSNSARLPTSFPIDSTASAGSQQQYQRAYRPEIRSFIVGIDYGSQNDAGRPGQLSMHHSGELIEADGSTSNKRDSGYIISGSEDRKIRYWSLGKIESSAVISGADIEEEKVVYS